MKNILLVLLFVTTQSLALIKIIGVDCLDLVVIDSENIVCVHTLEENKKLLLNITNNFDFVTGIYHILLWRHPDIAGETYWLNALNSKAVTKEQMLNIFINSEEYTKLHGK